MLQVNFAKKIVKEVRKLLNEEIVVMNTAGTIIASTNNERIGTFHEGALITSKKNEKLIIKKEDESFLEGVKAGINLPICFGKQVVGVIGITGEPIKVLPYAELLKKMTELLIQENFYKEEMTRQTRTLEAFIFDWLELREWDLAFYNRAELLNINLSVPRLLILVKVIREDQQLFDLSMKWRSERNRNDLCINWGNDRLLLLLEADPPLDHYSLKNKLYRWKNEIETSNHLSLQFGVGTIVQPTGLKKSFLKAERALHAITGHNWIMFDDHLTLEMIMEDLRLDTKKEFIQRTISPLLEDEELLQTLRVLFERNFSIKKTAEALHIHINTLHYRIKKIEDHTSLNPKKTKDQFTLYLGLYILDHYTK